MKNIYLLLFVLLSCNTYATLGPILGPLSFCNGSSTTLSNATPGGTWSTDALMIAVIDPASGVVAAVTAGTADVTYTLGTESVVATVTINSLPTPIIGSLAVCTGSFTTLGSATGGGTWMSMDPTIAAIDASGNAIGISPGVATIKYTAPTGCYRATLVTVNAVPPPITGPAAICVGSSATLSDAAVGGTWTSSNAMVAMVMGPVMGINPGTATITYAMPSGCFQTKTITVNPAPAMPGSIILCVGQSVAVIGGGMGSTWSVSSPSVATIGITSGLLTGVSVGTAVLTVTMPTGCVSTSIVTVNPAIGTITGPTALCNGSSITLSNSTPGGTWTCASPAIAFVNALTGEVTGLHPGTAAISYTVPSGCSATTIVTVGAIPSISGGPNVCVGSTITLSNYAGGGTWSSSASSIASIDAAGAVTGHTVGTATISYSAACGASTIAINVVSSIPAITGSGNVCVGSNTTLTNSISGGTWTSGNILVAVMPPTSGVITGVAAGTANITYSLGSCSAPPYTITVNPPPVAITGASSVCPGSSVALSDATPGGVWTVSNPNATVSTSGVVTGVSGSASTVTYTLSTGCFATKAISIYSQPVISGPSSVCYGGTINLSGSGGGVFTSSNAAIVSVTTSGVVSGIAFGTAIISLTNPSTTCTGTQTVNVTSLCTGTPVGGTTVAGSATCSSTPIALSLSGATIICGVGYQWQTSTDGSTWTNITGATSPAYSATTSAVRYYRSTLACGSSGLSASSVPVLVNPIFIIASHSVLSSPDTSCSASHFYITACGASSALQVITYFGDDASATVPLTPATGVYGAHIYHAYSLPGTYTVKQILLNGSMPVDSLSFSYVYSYCHTLPISVFYDYNNNCTFDGGEVLNSVPVHVKIDSNGVPVDTLSCTSGLYYKAKGGPGTVYAFSIIAVSGGLSASCPSGGILYDTIVSYTNTYTAKYFGLHCGSSSGHDLSIQTSVRQGIHSHQTTITVTNLRCYPVAPVVSVTCPRFSISPSPYWPSTTSPTPGVSGSTTTWALPSMSSGETRTIIATNEVPGGYSGWISLGDTAVTVITVSPFTGDIDTSNNRVIRIDTSKSGFDPNDIEVSPQGYILPCTQLQYTVRFENDGNDTAHNIYVLDTLAPGLDPSTLEVVSASSPMYISIIRSGSYNIAKFDFPNIMLPDSSHHGLCMGLFAYKIKARSTLADGSMVTNRAGIYFDDNPVVMTNDATNTIGAGPVNGPSNICAGTAVTVSDVMQGGIWSSSGVVSVTPTGFVTGSSAGAGIVSYGVSNSCVTRYATKSISVETLPGAGSITGPGSVCAGGTISLSNPVSGGVWHSDAIGTASVSGTGVVSGVAAGVVTISYTSTNSCGTNAATQVVTVNTFPAAGSITGVAAVCEGSVIALSSTSPGGGWLTSSSGIISISGAGVVTGLSAGTAPVSYYVSNSCGSDVVYGTVTVNTFPAAGTISGTTALCMGTGTTLGSSIAGGTWNSSTSAVATIGSTGYISGIAAGTTAISYTVTNSCGSAATGVIVNVETPLAGTTIAGVAELCFGAMSAFSSPTPGGAWSTASGAIASVDGSGNVTGMGTGTTTISYTRNNSCGVITTTAPITVMANELPALGISLITGGSLCAGMTATFTLAATYPGPTPVYQWIKNGAYAGSGVTYSYPPVTGDDVYCRMASSYACRLADTVASSLMVMVVDSVYIPTVTIAASADFTIGEGMYDTLTATADAAGPLPIYQWYINGIAVPGATNSVFVSNSFMDGDSVCCQVTGSGSCGQVVSQCSIIHITTGVIENENSATITVFPNPSNGKIIVRGKVAKSDESVSIEITNVLGQVVYKGNTDAKTGTIYSQIELANHLSNGVYQLSVQAIYEHKTFSFVLQR